MKLFNIKFSGIELILAMFFGVYVGYLLLAFATDIRIESVREFITKRGVDEGVRAAVVEYAKHYIENEDVMAKKRKARDKALKRYADKLNRILDMKDEEE